MQTVLKLQGISKTFGSRIILHDLDLELCSGKIIALLGRSGSGKSTLIKIIVGYHAADKGAITYEGNDITKKPAVLRSSVGYTTQENSFYEKLSILENMTYYASLYRLDRREREERIAHLLAEAGLWDNRHLPAESISGGMKRRLDFALSLLHHPTIVILDEPTAGLDPQLVRKFWEYVQRIVRKESLAVLVSTHILAEVQDYCDFAAFLSSGSLRTKAVSAALNLEREFDRL